MKEENEGLKAENSDLKLQLEKVIAESQGLRAHIGELTAENLVLQD